MDIDIDPAFCELQMGETVQMHAVGHDDHTIEFTVAWSSSDAQIASVDAKGLVSANSAGAAKIEAKWNGEVVAAAMVVVHADEQLVLPAELTVVAEGAFSGIDAAEIVIPEGTEAIRK